MEKERLNHWQQEILQSTIEKDFIGIAVFSNYNSLIFANKALKQLFPDFSPQKLINPALEKLWTLPQNDSTLIFDGYVTIGDYSRINLSLQAVIFRKQDELLMLTGYDYENLWQQNNSLHQLNREINDLQRQLINEKRNLENTLHQLDEKNHELRKTNLQKDKLFSVIAHDLKSPFSGIIGFAEILKENLHELTADQLKDYSQHIYRSANNTYNLIENLLEWASLQRSAIKLTPETIRIHKLAAEVLDLVIEQAAEKNITIQSEIPDALEWTADSNMLTSILRNLLTNAIKFSYPESTIFISARQINNRLEFSVADTGVGMTREKAEKLFSNEFYQSTRGTGDEKGSGLGLAICKDFVHMHNGKIWADSEIGQGSTITFSLPSAG